MRAIVLVTLLVAVTSAPAGACPRSPTCAVLDLRLRKPDPIKLAFTFEITAKPDRNAVPWIWQVLRREVYDRLPSYAPGDERRFTLTLAPVVVTSAFDTVPGIGFEGEF